MLEGEVGEDQRGASDDRLRLANHIPGRREPSELPSEPLLKAAVVSARRSSREDRIGRAELQGQPAVMEDTFRSQAKAWTFASPNPRPAVK